MSAAVPPSAERVPATELRVDGRADAADALVAFGFASAAGGLQLLGGAGGDECWHAAEPQRYRIETLRVADDGDIEAAAERGYRELLQRVRGSAQPYLLRIWNFFADINAGDGDRERYRRFCVGRARAADAHFHAPPPAATAIGIDGPARWLEIAALCSREPGIALENPRQTPAWRYPREFGPVSPGFSRGVVLGDGASAVLLASGTASIVGHVSQHVGDFDAQLVESLANLDALLAEGSARAQREFRLHDCMALRVYLRRADDLPRAQALVEARFGNAAKVRYLRGDVCRRELDVELEGAFAAARD